MNLLELIMKLLIQILVIHFLFFFSEKQIIDPKPERKVAKVLEAQGLILRDAPTTKGKQLALMREKEEVLV